MTPEEWDARRDALSAMLVRDGWCGDPTRASIERLAAAAIGCERPVPPPPDWVYGPLAVTVIDDHVVVVRTGDRKTHVTAGRAREMAAALVAAADYVEREGER